MQGAGFRVQGSGFRVQGSGFRVLCLGRNLCPRSCSTGRLSLLRHGLCIRMGQRYNSYKFRVCGLGCRVYQFRVER